MGSEVVCGKVKWKCLELDFELMGDKWMERRRVKRERTIGLLRVREQDGQ